MPGEGPELTADADDPADLPDTDALLDVRDTPRSSPAHDAPAIDPSAETAVMGSPAEQDAEDLTVPQADQSLAGDLAVEPQSDCQVAQTQNSSFASEVQQEETWLF
jgi:hypothetical protein